MPKKKWPDQPQPQPPEGAAPPAEQEGGAGDVPAGADAAEAPEAAEERERLLALIDQVIGEADDEPADGAPAAGQVVGRGAWRMAGGNVDHVGHVHTGGGTAPVS